MRASSFALTSALFCAMGVLLSGCLAVSVAGAAVGAAGTVVGVTGKAVVMTAKGAGAVVGAVVPGGGKKDEKAGS
jgi:hypothetical protein